MRTNKSEHAGVQNTERQGICIGICIGIGIGICIGCVMGRGTGDATAYCTMGPPGAIGGSADIGVKGMA